MPGWTNSREWTKYPEQQSSPISLAGGGKYYIEVLHKEADGNDNIAVAWGPGGSQQVIDGMKTLYQTLTAMSTYNFMDVPYLTSNTNPPDRQWIYTDFGKDGRSDCDAY